MTSSEPDLGWFGEVFNTVRNVSDIRPERICATYGVVSPPAGGVEASGSSSGLRRLFHVKFGLVNQI